MKLCPLEEESIHSFLIRTLMCQGYLLGTAGLNGIVNQRGYVNALPHLDSTRSAVFNDFSDEDVKDLIIKHSPIIKIFEDDIVKFKKYLFDGVTLNPSSLFPSGKTKLRYCHFCLFEQMRVYGFTCFKLEWLFDVECLKHQIPLSNVKTNRSLCCGLSLNIYQSVISVLTGKCQSCNRISWIYNQIVEWESSDRLGWCDYISTHQDRIHLKI